ncbi:hypothetical protein BL166_00003645, partial [Klebsiella pneumoniae]
SAQIREILISESAWEEMTCLFAPSLNKRMVAEGAAGQAACGWLVWLPPPTPHAAMSSPVTGLFSFLLPPPDAPARAG